MLTLALVFGSGMAVCAARGTLGRVTLDWQAFLTPAGDRALSALIERLGADREMVRITYEQARTLAAHSVRRTAVLAAAHGLMLELARERVRLLDAMRRYSWTATQIESLSAIRPTTFGLPFLKARAGLAALGHFFLVGSPERFRVRLSLLRRGVRDVLSATRRLARGQAGPATLDAVLADWDTIDRETIASFRAVATAILAPPIPRVGLTPRRP